MEKENIKRMQGTAISKGKTAKKSLLAISESEEVRGNPERAVQASKRKKRNGLEKCVDDNPQLWKSEPLNPGKDNEKGKKNKIVRWARVGGWARESRVLVSEVNKRKVPGGKKQNSGGKPVPLRDTKTV